jgi:hypothetical protein
MFYGATLKSDCKNVSLSINFFINSFALNAEFCGTFDLSLKKLAGDAVMKRVAMLGIGLMIAILVA